MCEALNRNDTYENDPLSFDADREHVTDLLLSLSAFVPHDSHSRAFILKNNLRKHF